MSQKISVAASSPLSASSNATARKGQRPLKVLCATRALSHSDAVVARAHTIARELGAQLRLLHVVDAGPPMRTARRRGALAHTVLDETARELGLSSDQISVQSGRPYQTIADVAVEWDADLIVIGPYRRRFGESVRGTSAERIAQRAGRPVLVVNRPSSEPYRKVLLTSDLSRMSARIARVTQDLGLLDRANRAVVHAMKDTRNEMLFLAGLNRGAANQFERSLRHVARDEINMQLNSVGLDPTQFKVFAPQVTAIRAIEGLARRTGSELIVVGSSRFPELKRVFSDSVSNGVLREGKYDVLLVSPAAALRARRRATAIERRMAAQKPQPVHELH